MITDAILYADGQPVRPFFPNPWRDDPRPMDTLTRRLGGEWPCVPFGVTQHTDRLPTDWQCDATPTAWHQHAHGFGAHSIWSLTQQDVHFVTADISYPISSPIVRLKRTVCLTAENEITLGLEIEARAHVRIPIGLHPVLSLADAAPETALMCNGTRMLCPAVFCGYQIAAVIMRRGTVEFARWGSNPSLRRSILALITASRPLLCWHEAGFGRALRCLRAKYGGRPMQFQPTNNCLRPLKAALTCG